MQLQNYVANTTVVQRHKKAGTFQLSADCWWVWLCILRQSVFGWPLVHTMRHGFAALCSRHSPKVVRTAQCTTRQSSMQINNMCACGGYQRTSHKINLPKFSALVHEIPWLWVFCASCQFPYTEIWRTCCCGSLLKSWTDFSTPDKERKQQVER